MQLTLKWHSAHFGHKPPVTEYGVSYLYPQDSKFSESSVYKTWQV